MKDYSTQDASDLRELIERYRTGFGMYCVIEAISARWMEQNREVCEIPHRAKEDIPIPEVQKILMDKFMSELSENDRRRS